VFLGCRLLFVPSSLFLRKLSTKDEPTLHYPIAHILHQHQKSGFLRLMQPETLDYSLINRFFQVLLRMVQDVRLAIRKELLKKTYTWHKKGNLALSSIW